MISKQCNLKNIRIPTLTRPFDIHDYVKGFRVEKDKLSGKPLMDLKEIIKEVIPQVDSELFKDKIEKLDNEGDAINFIVRYKTKCKIKEDQKKKGVIVV